MLLGYTRVSTTEQAADDKGSLEQQERIIRGYAMAKGFKQFDTAIYSDPGVSASMPLTKRPAGGEMFRAAKAGDTIIAAKLDRIFRSSSDALNMIEIFNEKKIKLVLFDLGTEPVAESGIAQFIFTILAAVATLERTMIKERCVNGKKAKIVKGGHVGGSAPYGFRIVGTGRNARLEENPDEQKVIARVKSIHHDNIGFPLRATVAILTEEGMRSRTGRVFDPTQINRILNAEPKHAVH